MVYFFAGGFRKGILTKQKENIRRLPIVWQGTRTKYFVYLELQNNIN